MLEMRNSKDGWSWKYSWRGIAAYRNRNGPEKLSTWSRGNSAAVIGKVLMLMLLRMVVVMMMEKFRWEEWAYILDLSTFMSPCISLNCCTDFLLHILDTYWELGWAQTAAANLLTWSTRTFSKLCRHAKIPPQTWRSSRREGWITFGRRLITWWYLFWWKRGYCGLTHTYFLLEVSVSPFFGSRLPRTYMQLSPTCLTKNIEGADASRIITFSFSPNKPDSGNSRVLYRHQPFSLKGFLFDSANRPNRLTDLQTGI